MLDIPCFATVAVTESLSNSFCIPKNLPSKPLKLLDSSNDQESSFSFTLKSSLFNSCKVYLFTFLMLNFFAPESAYAITLWSDNLLSA